MAGKRARIDQKDVIYNIHTCMYAGGQDCVDVVRFMKMLYFLVCPDGLHAPGRYLRHD